MTAIALGTTMGRPRVKNRDRYPGGKLKPMQPQETAAPNTIRRIITAAKVQAADKRLGTELGRLRLSDVLDDRQYVAGVFFGIRCGVYDRAKGLPSRHPASLAYQEGRGRSSGREPSDEAVRTAERRYDEAVDILGSVRATKIVAAVVIYDQGIVAGDHHLLRAGLTALADKWGITGRENLGA